MTAGFPPIDPYDSGTIDVGDGHRVQWECCGNPAGEPALFLHGGPGSGCSPGSRRFFDPSVYRAVLFDQRGSGRSRPLASAPDADLKYQHDRSPHRRHRTAAAASVDAYAALVFDPRDDVRVHAAREWCAWEDAHVSLAPGHRPNPRFDDEEFRLRFTRLVTHYWRHAAFLEDGRLLRDASTLNGIPGVLVHGRYDVSGPLETAWRLSQSWTTSRLHVIDAGHGGNDAFPAAVTGALDQLVRQPIERASRLGPLGYRARPRAARRLARALGRR